MNFKNILLCIVFTLGLTSFSFGQSSAELKKLLEKIDGEIASLQKDLRAKTKEKLLSQQEVNALSKQLNLREQKISTINAELRQINNRISSNTKAINELEKSLEKLRSDYEKMILFAFRNKNAYNKMMFIFAAKDFNQAFKRVKYLQQFSDARKVKVTEMETTKAEIELKNAQLEVDRQAQNALLKEQQKERDIIAQDRAAHSKQLRQVAQQEKSFQGQLTKKQQERNKINAQIKAAIARELAEARRLEEEKRRKAAEAEAKRTGQTVAEVEKTIPKKTDTEVLNATPQAAKLSADFQANKGRLPWPVAQGNIVRGYGSVMIEGIRDFMPDIAIRTTDSAPVRAIFDGEVVQVYPGIVVIKHGSYFSFYSNLATTSVRRGQKISRGQQVGTAAEDPDLGFPVVNFGLSQGQNDFDPTPWIAR